MRRPVKVSKREPSRFSKRVFIRLSDYVAINTVVGLLREARFAWPKSLNAASSVMLNSSVTMWSFKYTEPWC